MMDCLEFGPEPRNGFEPRVVVSPSERKTGYFFRVESFPPMTFQLITLSCDDDKEPAQMKALNQEYAEWCFRRALINPEKFQGRQYKVT